MLPAAVAVLLVVPVLVAVKRCVAEAAALRASLGTLGELAPGIRQVRLEAAALAAEVPLVLRRRSVVAPDTAPELPPADTRAGRRALASGPE